MEFVRKLIITLSYPSRANVKICPQTKQKKYNYRNALTWEHAMEQEQEPIVLQTRVTSKKTQLLSWCGVPLHMLLIREDVTRFKACSWTYQVHNLFFVPLWYLPTACTKTFSFIWDAVLRIRCCETAKKKKVTFETMTWCKDQDPNREWCLIAGQGL